MVENCAWGRTRRTRGLGEKHDSLDEDENLEKSKFIVKNYHLVKNAKKNPGPQRPFAFLSRRTRHRKRPTHRQTYSDR